MTKNIYFSSVKHDKEVKVIVARLHNKTGVMLTSIEKKTMFNGK